MHKSAGPLSRIRQGAICWAPRLQCLPKQNDEWKVGKDTRTRKRQSSSIPSADERTRMRTAGNLSDRRQVSRRTCRPDVRFDESYGLLGLLPRSASRPHIASPGFSCRFAERPSSCLPRDAQLSLRFVGSVQNLSATRQVGRRTSRPHAMHYPYPWVFLGVTFSCGGLWRGSGASCPFLNSLSGQPGQILPGFAGASCLNSRRLGLDLFLSSRRR